MTKNINQEQLNQIKELHQTGQSLTKIAQNLQISRSTLTKAKRANFNMQNLKEINKMYKQNQKANKLKKVNPPKNEGLYTELLKRVRAKNYSNIAEYIAQNGIEKFNQEIKS